MINSVKYHIPEQLAKIFNFNEIDKKNGLRPILRDQDVVGNFFYKKFIQELKDNDLAWPPVWNADVLGALEIIYSFSEDLKSNWSCGEFCKNKPPVVTGLELEYIVGNEDILKDDDFQDDFLKRAQSTPEAYLSRELNCVFYNSEENKCMIENPPFICHLQKQDVNTEEWKDLINMFYYVVDQANILNSSLLYGTLITHFLINYYYIFPYFQKATSYKSEESLYDDVYKNLEKNNIVRSWMKIGFQAHNYILSVDEDISRLYNSVEIKRNDICPCGSGKKYKYCCM